MKWGMRGQRHCQTHRSKGCLPGALTQLQPLCAQEQEGPQSSAKGVQATDASQGHVAWPAVGRPTWLPKGGTASLGWQGSQRSPSPAGPARQPRLGHPEAVGPSHRLGILKEPSLPYHPPNLTFGDSFFLMVVPIFHVSNTHLK